MADIDWKAQTDLVRSGDLSPRTVEMATQHQLSELGRTGYMEAYPEVFGPGSVGYPMSVLPGYEEEQKIKDLRSLLFEYAGPEATMIRWLIRNRIKDLEYQSARLRGLSQARAPEYEPPPVPKWMKPYIQTTTTTVQPRGAGGKRREPITREEGTLIPLGAQAELTPEQMAQMAGYQAWQKAGAPTKFSGAAMRGMSDWSRWWEPHVRQSQSLFPKQQKLTPKWGVARQ